MGVLRIDGPLDASQFEISFYTEAGGLIWDHLNDWYAVLGTAQSHFGDPEGWFNTSYFLYVSDQMADDLVIWQEESGGERLGAMPAGFDSPVLIGAAGAQSAYTAADNIDSDLPGTGVK